MRKILCLVIISLFCLTSLLPTYTTIGDAGFNTNIFTNSYIIYDKEVDKGISFLCPDDELDQENTDWEGSGLAGFTYPMAQSFKPTLNLLTRVELIAWRVGNPQGNLTISIRENLSGTDLASVSILAENIPLEYGPPALWTGFDFPDINVMPEHAYYIVWSHDSWDHDNHVAWGDTRSTDHYPRGEAWWILNDTWVSRGPNYDFCFKTYRWLNNSSPGKPDIDGPSKLKPGTEYPYYFYSNDPDNNNIFYYIDWGDGSINWLGPYAPGEKIYKSHKWSEIGTYTIKAKARDEHGNESDWAYLEVSMPKNKENNKFINNVIFERTSNAVIFNDPDMEPPVTNLYFDTVTGEVTLIAIKYPLNSPCEIKATYYKIDSGEFQVYTAPFILPEGTHTVYFYSEDTCGNIESVKSKTLTFDTTPPIVSITLPREGRIYIFGNPIMDRPLSDTTLCIGKVPVQATADDNGGTGVNKVLFSYNGKTAWDDTAPYEDVFRGRVFGDLTISVTAIDNLGHESDPVEMTIRCYSLG